MKIFEDIFSKEELCSDVYPMCDVDDLVYEFDGKSITVVNGISDAAIGGNASQEGGEDEGSSDQAESVINIVYSHGLVETAFNKKSYMCYIKDYMKRLLTKLQDSNPERAGVFKKAAPAFIKKVLNEFDEYRFFTGKTMDPDAMVVLCRYRENQITPFFIIFKDGVTEEKV